MAPQNLFIIGDFGKDLDDEVTAVLAAQLQREGLVNIVGVIANLDPAIIRAQLAKGTFNALGLPNIPVAVGSDCRFKDRNPKDYQFAAPYLANQSELSRYCGPDLFGRVCVDLPDGSVKLLLISGMTDARNIIEEYPGLFRRKVSEVVVMGGVINGGGRAERDQQGLLIPDKTSNNTFDYPAACELYREVQRSGKIMVFVTRNAAYAASVPARIYDDLAQTGHPIGARFKATQEAMMQSWWQQCNLPYDDPDRTLPKGPEDNPRNKEWFCRTFCGGDGLDRSGEDSIWDCIKNFALYDPLTLMAALHNIRNTHFKPEYEITGMTHFIVGKTPENHGVIDPDKTRQFLIEKLTASLSTR